MGFLTYLREYIDKKYEIYFSLSAESLFHLARSIIQTSPKIYFLINNGQNLRRTNRKLGEMADIAKEGS